MKHFVPTLFGWFLLAFTPQSLATVVINEFMASNSSTIFDEDGDYEDWIELYNTGSESVDLSGWGLSDDPDKPMQWVFPSTVIESGEHLVVWASGKDRFADPYRDEWHGDYTVQAEGIWLFREESGTTAIDSSGHLNHGTIHGAARSHREDITTALVFGEGDRVDLSSEIILDDDFTVSYWFITSRAGQWRALNSSVSWVYTIGHAASNRVHFWGPFSEIRLDLPFETGQWHCITITRQDDEVDVYRNGVLIGHGTWSGMLRVDRWGGRSAGTGGWTDFEGAISDPIILAHALAADEIWNLYVAQISTHSHANFRISRDGESLLLSGPGGVVDMVHPVSVPSDISYGRQPDGTENWRFFDQPTPGWSNSTIGYLEIMAPPGFSHAGGFFTDGFDLSLWHADPEAEIIYTLDGSQPDPEALDGKTYLYKNAYPQSPGADFGPFLTNSYRSYLYTSPISVINRTPEPDKLTQISSTYHTPPFYLPETPVHKGVVVRARAVKTGALPSAVATHTYFVTPDGPANPYNLPVIMIAIQEDFLFDYHNGIYVAGEDFDNWRLANPEDPAHGDKPANYYRRGREWEFPGHMAYYETGSVAAASCQDMGLRIHGAFSRANRNKSLRLYARSDYGATLFEQPFFPCLDDASFKRLILRNSGNDGGSTLFRDAAIQTMVRHLNFDTQAYQPAVLFINGEYWGIHNIRERYDLHYLERVYGIDPNKVDLLTAGIPRAKEGTTKHFRAMMDYIAKHCMSEPEYYDYITTQMDIVNYIDYIIAQVFARNDDWPHGNIDFWRLRTDEHQPDAPTGHDGRWRWMMFDMDCGFGLSARQGDRYSMDMLSWITNTNRNTHVNIITINLLKNDAFRTQFIRRFADLLNTAFLPERTTAVIEELKQGIENEIDRHYSRWKYPVGSWDRLVGVMTNFVYVRPDYQRQHIRDFFELEDDVEIILDVNNPSGGHVRVNTIEIIPETPGVPHPPYPWSGQYFHGVPIEVEAVPAPGYRFSHWEGIDEPDAHALTRTLDMTGHTSLQAIFEPIPLSELPVGLHVWEFEDEEDYLLPSYTLGGGSLDITPGSNTVVSRNKPAQDFDTAHLRINEPLGAELVFALPTTDYEGITLEYETRHSGSGAGEQTLSYATNGIDWIEWTTYEIFDAPPQRQSFDFSSIEGINDNSNFAVRITFAQGAKDEEGNNRFDNVVLRGIALEGANIPPVIINTIDFQELIQGADAVNINLNEVFTDPNGDPLTFGAGSSDTNMVTVQVVGSMLSVTPVRRGEARVTVTADDGEAPPVSTSFRVLVYPNAYVLQNGNFTFGEWHPDTPEKIYPEHMLFVQSDRSDTALDTPLLYAYHIKHNDYHAYDQGTIGFPYNNTGRTRINGLGEEGIAFINTGRGRDLGGALLALDTRNMANVLVDWLAGTVLANDREYAIRLQYRLGTTGDFIDVLDESEQPVEYVRQTDGHTQPMDPVKLPPEAMGEEYVQLLWRYYRTSKEYDSGPRAQLRLDDIRVEGAPIGFAAWQNREFSLEELEDPGISGPLADPEESGIQNLMRYALGLGRYDAYEGVWPGTKVGAVPIFRYRRRIAEDSGIEYIIEVTGDLAASIWEKVVMGSDLIELEAMPTGDDITEIVTHEVPGATLITPRYFRLRVVLEEY